MTDNDVLIDIDSVSKKFCRSLRKSLYYGARDVAAECLGRARSSESLRNGEFWAVRNVGFQLRRGDSIGVLGANGAGKTTLFRMVSGLIKPDTGSIQVRGRVAPLIALGAGFNPILSGRENVYVNMSILGLNKREIDERFDEVIDFAQIGDAIDAPVQTYSSGMAARLGFSCALHTDPDILLIDEVLAVGDIAFKDKCFRRLATLRERGTSFLLISHNSHAIFCACTSAVYMKQGELMAAGDVGEVTQQYEQDIWLANKEESPASVETLPRPHDSGTDLSITSIHAEDAHGNVTDTINSAEAATLCVRCHARQPCDDINLTVVVRDVQAEKSLALILSNHIDGVSLSVERGENELRMRLPVVGLRMSVYSLEVKVRRGALYVFDEVPSFVLRVTSRWVQNQCLFHQGREWESCRVTSASRRAG